MELIRGLKPKRILLIGGGAFVLPKAIAQDFPQTAVTVVEIDAELPRLAAKYFEYAPSQQVTIHLLDGRQFLERTDATYDLIVLDVFGDANMPRAFQTSQTAALLLRRLRRKGVVAINIIAAAHGQRSMSLRRQVSALRSQFDYLQLFPAEYGQSPWLPQNFILTAQSKKHDLTKLLRYAPLPLPGS